MNLPSNVKQKNILWDLIPWVGNTTAQGIYPNIYVPKFVYENLKSKNPSPWHMALLLHEQEHLKRQKKMGIFRWGAKYLLDPKFRLDEELEASKPAFSYLKKRKLTFNIEKKARMLSSWVYFWCTSYKNAKKDLGRVWTEA